MTARPRDAVLAALALACVTAVAVAGRLATAPHLASWYAGLDKPGFTPPDGVFAPAWATLYLLMGLALWRVLRQAPAPARQRALVLFFAQLALNAAWPWMFFAANSPQLGLINVGLQLGLVVAAVAACWRVDRLAGLCLVPLAAWVAFALALNLAIWRLNP